MYKLLVCIALFVCYTGCTIVGGIVGIALPQEEEYSKAELNLDDIKGETITINKQDSLEISCVLDSVITIDDSVYQSLYSDYKQLNSVKIPFIEIAAEYRIDQREEYYKFTGFDFGGLRFDSLWTGHSAFLDFNEFEYLVDKSSNKFTASRIRELYDSYKLPLKSKLVVNVNNKKEIYESLDVNTITTSSSNPFIQSILVGLTIDILLILGFANM